jgi:hypothetical protein
MEFKGNFGQLTLNIEGTEATGTYQENGVLKGKFINNTFIGQWKNKGLEGLVEFTITGDKLLGNWKKGVETGKMKGKWEGKKINYYEDKIIGITDNEINNVIIEFLINNSNLDFNLTEYKNFVISFLKNFDLIENENDQIKIEKLFKELLELVSNNPSKYGGCVYLFKQIVYEVSEHEQFLDFNFELIKANSYSLDQMLNEGTPVKLVCNDFDNNDFKMVFITKMLFSLLTIIDETDDFELIAEFIVASNINQFTNIKNDYINDEDWISDLVIEILDIMGYDIYDYEGTTHIPGNYFMEIGQSMGFDYIRLAEDFYESNI